MGNIFLSERKRAEFSSDANVSLRKVPAVLASLRSLNLPKEKKCSLQTNCNIIIVYLKAVSQVF